MLKKEDSLCKSHLGAFWNVKCKQSRSLQNEVKMAEQAHEAAVEKTKRK